MSGIVIDETTPGSARYIESGGGKMFYQSEVPPGDIPLKRKYTIGGSAPSQNKHSDNQGRGAHKLKLSQKMKDALPSQPVMVRVANVQTGSTRMMTATQFAHLDWGWPIV